MTPDSMKITFPLGTNSLAPKAVNNEKSSLYAFYKALEQDVTLKLAFELSLAQNITSLLLTYQKCSNKVLPPHLLGRLIQATISYNAKDIIARFEGTQVASLENYLRDHLLTILDETQKANKVTTNLNSFNFLKRFRNFFKQ